MAKAFRNDLCRAKAGRAFRAVRHYTGENTRRNMDSRIAPMICAATA